MECAWAFLYTRNSDHSVLYMFFQYVKLFTMFTLKLFPFSVNYVKVSDARSLHRDEVENGLTFAGFAVTNKYLDFVHFLLFS